MSSDTSHILAGIDGAFSRGEPAYLATLVRVEGSAYRRPGARMLVLADGTTVGAISGGCLERQVAQDARALLADRSHAIVRYDASSDDDRFWGFALGCSGAIDVLLEKIEPGREPAHVGLLRQVKAGHEPAAIAHVFHADAARRGEVLGRISRNGAWNVEASAGCELAVLTDRVRLDVELALREGRSLSTSYSTASGLAHAFIEVVRPPTTLAVFGSGYDVRPMIDAAHMLGWRVWVLDLKIGQTARENLASADRLLAIKPGDLASVLADCTGLGAAVLMTHRYPDDLRFVQEIVKTPVKYVGVLGPRHRTDRILADLHKRHIELTPQQVAKLYGPAGLDIAAETPQQIALSIVAEIHAVLAGRSGASLRERAGSIHDRDRDDDHAEVEPSPSITACASAR